MQAAACCDKAKLPNFPDEAGPPVPLGLFAQALGALSSKDGPEVEAAPAVKLVPRPGIPRSKVQLTPSSHQAAEPRESRELNQSTVRLQDPGGTVVKRSPWGNGGE
eukprot:Skav232729  [mRNA]  locus=scaffold1843:87070:97515:- [translate_table: standard]